MPVADLKDVKNKIVMAMEEEDRSVLLDRSRIVTFTKIETLQKAGENIHHVYFPLTGWISFLVTMEDGHSSEVGVVGREGVAGTQVALGHAKASFEWVVQGPGKFLQLDVPSFRKLLGERPNVQALLSRFSETLHDQVAQTAACNLTHTVDQRLARWLLLSHDRSESDTLFLTQDLLAMMLGVRRAGVTVSAGVLKDKGFIDYSRGSVTVRDRAGLEAVACECYQAVRRRCDAPEGLN